MRAIIPLLLTFLLAVSGAPASAQDDRTASEAVANSWVRGIDQGDLASIYQRHAGPTLTRAMTQQLFVDQTGILRVQLGMPAQSRQLVGAQPFQQTPTGQSGTFFFFRYKTRYQNGGILFQDVYLEKIGSDWKVAGVWMMPAPPD